MTNTLVTDIDGVLLDFEFVIRSALERKFGGELGMPHCFNFEEAYGISSADLGAPSPTSEMWRDIYSQRAELYPDAFEFVIRLKKAGIRVVGVSYRCELGREASKRDLSTVPLDELHYVNHPSEKHDYLQAAADLGRAWFIDDHSVHAANAAYAVSSARVYLLSRPYNRRCLDLGDYHRANSLSDILTEIGA